MIWLESGKSGGNSQLHCVLQSAAHGSMENVIKDHLIASCRHQLNINLSNSVLLRICDEGKFRTTTKYFIPFHRGRAVYFLYLIQSLLGSLHLCRYI